MLNKTDFTVFGNTIHSNQKYEILNLLLEIKKIFVFFVSVQCVLQPHKLN